MRFLSSCCTATLLVSVAFAQFPPTPEGLTTKQVESIPGASISYKETFICETQARAWAGYVHLPASALADIQTDEPYDLSMFFWYFEAREDPRNAPTAIYLAGGPGEPGVSGPLGDGGPCTVNADANSTTNNPYSWNNYVNMLYIDQPVSTGFSYTKLVKSTLNLMFLTPLTPEDTGITSFEAYNGSVPSANTTFTYGLFSEQSDQKTANSTLTAAKTIWHVSQAWFSTFPEYNTCNKEVNFLGNSYGGYFVPVTAAYFLRQNEKIVNGQLDGTIIPIDTVGWTNGCTDLLIQGEWYPEQAYNNTYGLQVLSKQQYDQANNDFSKPGGCRDQIVQCRELGDMYDPDQLNINATVNGICAEATKYCYTKVAGAFANEAITNRSQFDMTHLNPDPWPPVYWYGYLTQEWVLKELGVPINFTAYSLLANNLFFSVTGDPIRTNGRKPMEYLLDQGVKVAMVYGDRDYRCPWNGAEKLSLAAEWSGSEDFANAGYEYVQTNASYQGGLVRQYGNFSFSRVFEAGHDAQAYQPETVWRLFNRAIFSKDLATGEKTDCGTSNDCATTGPSSTFHIKNKLPPPPPFNCNILAVGGTCTIEQYDALRNNTALIVDYNVIKPVGVTPGKLTNTQ